MGIVLRREADRIICIRLGLSLILHSDSPKVCPLRSRRDAQRIVARASTRSPLRPYQIWDSGKNVLSLIYHVNGTPPRAL